VTSGASKAATAQIKVCLVGEGMFVGEETEPSFHEILPSIWDGERQHWKFIIMQHKIALRHIQEHNHPRKKINIRKKNGRKNSVA
jgi:hypothetical protein